MQAIGMPAGWVPIIFIAGGHPPHLRNGGVRPYVAGEDDGIRHRIVLDEEKGFILRKYVDAVDREAYASPRLLALRRAMPATLY